MPVAFNMTLTALLILLVNIPFGYWRANVRRFGPQWFLAIHLPVPFVVLLRYAMHTGWHWSTFVMFIMAFFTGQMLGGYIHRKMLARHPQNYSSCLFMDLYRNG
jgi:hypothetical protein